MLETGIEDEHIRLINNQMEFGSTIGMVPALIPFTKWTFLPIPWLQHLQAGRERLKEVSWSNGFVHIALITNHATSSGL